MIVCKLKFILHLSIYIVYAADDFGRQHLNIRCMIFFVSGEGLSLFSSPEPKAHWRANSIPVTSPSSVVRRLSTFSNIFSSETTGPIELIFHMETP